MTLASDGQEFKYEWRVTRVYLSCVFFGYGIAIFLLVLGESVLVLDLDAQSAVEAHPLIGDPGQYKKGDYVPAKVVYQQLKARNDDKEKTHPKTEAVLAGENIKELSLEQSTAGLAPVFAHVAYLFEDSLLCHRPGDRGYRQREYQQPIKLFESHQITLTRELKKRRCAHLRDCSVFMEGRNKRFGDSISANPSRPLRALSVPPVKENRTIR